MKTTAVVFISLPGVDLVVSWSGAHFTNAAASILIQIQWTMHFDITQFLGIWSQQNFTQATTAQLLWHVQNFVVITQLDTEWEQNKCFVEFDFQWKNHYWNGPQDQL